jgi:two-component system, NarL family, response regulator LiaR
MSDGTIRILLADDHQLLRNGLQAIIDIKPDMKVVGHASDGVEAVRQYRALKPDVVIMDLVMPVKDGVEATSDILAEDPQAHILVLTSFSESERITLAMRAGAQGYILKDTMPDELIQAIRQVSRGMVTIQPAILEHLFHQPVKSAEEQTEKLTARETEVLKLVARGLNNDAIAAQLYISKSTVNVHITHIMGKLNAANRVQMTLFALSHGLVGLFDRQEGSNTSF